VAGTFSITARMIETSGVHNMNGRLIVFGFALFATSCGSTGTNSNNSIVAKTNVEVAAKPAYSQSENAYTLAWNSDLAGELGPSGKAAKEIVGKTLTEAKLWQNRKFERRLSKLMGPELAAMKQVWNTEEPIKKFGDFLMMTGCETQNCPDNRYVIFVDLGLGSINVLHLRNGETREWNGNRKIDLPPPFADNLAALKASN
jgi:hypothetical protein